MGSISSFSPPPPKKNPGLGWEQQIHSCSGEAKPRMGWRWERGSVYSCCPQPTGGSPPPPKKSSL